MENKNELLKKLGFSDSFIKRIDKDEFNEVTFTTISDSTSFIEPIDIEPSDSNKIVIDKTSKPQSMVYNSIRD